MTGLKKVTLALATAGLLSSGAVQAALNDRGGGLIYDDALNITWLSDANYAKTSGYDANGAMTWSAANTWAANLSFAGYSDWRLPTTLQPDAGCSFQGPIGSYGTGCAGSEMGHMYYNNFGIAAPNTIVTATNTANLALFTNLEHTIYWTDTAWVPSPTVEAWNFHFNEGNQYVFGLGNEFFAWAVHSGDIGAVAAVPEPETYAMLLAGLGVLGFAARRRKQKAV